MCKDELINIDPEIYELIKRERLREEQGIELIASENFTSLAVMEACGSILTNKYAEGYPGKRYYGGCEVVDEVEQLAIDRAKKLFGANFVNVQPHSGSQANMAAYFSLINPGDTVLAMNLSHGGHLTHGAEVSFSGKLYKPVFYGVSEKNEQIDYEEVRNLALKHRPKLILAGASSYSRAIDFKRFRDICTEVGAYLFVDMAHIAGLVAAGLHQSPIDYADIVTTTTHKTLRGPRSAIILTNNEEIAKKVDKSVFPGIQGGPLMHVIAGKAVCFKEAMTDEFKEYQKQVIKNSAYLSKALETNGFRVVSGGTDNHMFCLDLRAKNVTGKEAETILGRVNITVNKNVIPFETQKASVASGIRIGTAAVTSRGMKEDQMSEISTLINSVLEGSADENSLHDLKNKVLNLAERFPLYKA